MNTVLLIEPDKTVKDRIRDELEGFKLISVDSASGVVAKTRHHTPDVIVMDVVSIPGDVGFEIFQKLHGSRRTSDTPIVLLSVGCGPEELELEEDSFVRSANLQTLARRVEAAVREGLLRRAVREALPSEMLSTEDPGGAEATVEGGSFDPLTSREREVLARGGAPADPQLDLQPVARRIARYQDLLATSLTTTQAADWLGVTPSRIRQLLLEKPPRLYGIRLSHSWSLPAFQFGEEGLIPNFDRALAHLDRGLDPVAVVGWFERPNLDLEGEEGSVSPLHWLSQGKDWRLVAELAEDL